MFLRKRNPVRTRRTVRRRRFTKRSVVARRPVRRLRARRSRPSSDMIGRTPRAFARLSWSRVLDNVSIAAASVQYYPVYIGTPTPASASAPAAADVLYDGLQLYANFYYFCRNHAAKLRVNIQNTGGDNAIRVGLIALPYAMGSAGAITGNTPAALGALTYEQFTSMPGVRKATLGILDGSRNQVTLSMYRKSKRMFDKTNLRDDENSNQIIYTDKVHANYSKANDMWMFYLYLYNVDATNAQKVNVQFNLSTWTEFFGPRFQYQQALT